MANEKTDVEGLADGSHTPRKHLIQLSFPYLCAYIGFGFFFSWIWLGLYQGYPVFRSGEVDSISCITLLGGFSLCLFVSGFVPSIRQAVGSRALLLFGSASACLGSFLVTTVQLDLVSLDYAVYIACIRTFLFFAGVGTAVLLLHFGAFFSKLEPMSALLAFCLSFIASFFAFFGVNSMNFPFSYYLVSTYPLICFLTSCRVCDERKGKEADAEPRNEGYARGYVRMVTAFAVYVFTAGLTQSLEPQKDFALSVDEGMVGFFLVAMILFYLVVFSKRRIGTFSILKKLYQVTTILMVLKFILQPLASDDSAFAAINVVTYLTLFMVFWLLGAFVGHIGDTHPVKVYALLFGLAGICMAFGWVFGSLMHIRFGYNRYIVSIAAGCAVTVFCTFGFSVKDFPCLTLSGKAVSKRDRRNCSKESAEEPVVATTEMVIEEIAVAKKLSRREKEILALLVKGMTTEAVANELVISYYTVRTHIRNIYAKLNVDSRSDLLVLVMQYGRKLSEPKPTDE